MRMSGDVQGCTNAASAGMRMSGPRKLVRNSLLRGLVRQCPLLPVAKPTGTKLDVCTCIYLAWCPACIWL